jgi:hypothetical protein
MGSFFKKDDRLTTQVSKPAKRGKSPILQTVLLSKLNGQIIFVAGKRVSAYANARLARNRL